MVTKFPQEKSLRNKERNACDANIEQTLVICDVTTKKLMKWGLQNKNGFHIKQ